MNPVPILRAINRAPSNKRKPKQSLSPVSEILNLPFLRELSLGLVLLLLILAVRTTRLGFKNGSIELNVDFLHSQKVDSDCCMLDAPLETTQAKPRTREDVDRLLAVPPVGLLIRTGGEPGSASRPAQRSGPDAPNSLASPDPSGADSAPVRH